MFDAKRLLDALIGAAARIGQPAQEGQPSGTAPGPSQQGGAPADLGPQVAGTVRQVTGQTPEQLLQTAKRIMEQNPGLAQAAAIGLAGLLFGKSKPGRGVSANLAKLGGLAVIGGLAYKAWQNSKAGRPLLDMGGVTATEAAAPAATPAPLPKDRARASRPTPSMPSTCPKVRGSIPSRKRRTTSFSSSAPWSPPLRRTAISTRPSAAAS